MRAKTLFIGSLVLLILPVSTRKYGYVVCTLYIVYYTLCKIYSIHYNIFKPYTILYTLHTILYTLYSIQYTLHSTQYTVYILQLTLYTMKYTGRIRIVPERAQSSSSKSGHTPSMVLDGDNSTYSETDNEHESKYIRVLFSEPVFF